MVFENIQTKQEIVAGNVLYTYDVLWRASNVRWASRWDIYLSMDNAVPDKVHWFSIVNSMLIVLFLSVMVAMILIRNLTLTSRGEHDVRVRTPRARQRRPRRRRARPRSCISSRARGRAPKSRVLTEDEKAEERTSRAGSSCTDVFRPPRRCR